MILRSLLSFIYSPFRGQTSASPKCASCGKPAQCAPTHSDDQFRVNLEREAYESMFTPQFRAELERAMDICYGDRPTTYTRKLLVIQGGKR